MSKIALATNLLNRFQRDVATLFEARRPRGIALALSGGVDSMALSWLFHTSNSSPKVLQSSFEPYRNIPFFAIIVNHKLRPESDQESLDTSDRFWQLTGQKPLIIDLDWASQGGIPVRTRLETAARRMRYRALGLACRDLNIDTVFTGHHADDTAETVLLRIGRGARDRGLHGIFPLVSIPECSDIYGVSEKLLSEDHIEPTKDISLLPRLEPGVKVVRPLLNFDKAELISLCRENGVDWVEDPTNKDSTLTFRNAVRRALESDSLPKAFRKPSLLSLAEHKMSVLHDEDLETKKLHTITKKSLDCRSGILSFVLPEPVRSERFSWRDMRAFIRDMVFAISAKPAISTAECDNFLRSILRIDAELRQTSLKDRNSQLLSVRDEKLVPTTKTPETVASVAASASLDFGLGGKKVVKWHFTQQALIRSQRRVVHLVKDSNGFDTPDSPYMTLWDGRFWIFATCKTGPRERMPANALNEYQAEIGISHGTTVGSHEMHCPDAMIIRTLNAVDLQALRDIVRSGEYSEAGIGASNAISRYKSMQKFGSMMLVLPVIVALKHKPNGGLEETITCIPSLSYIRPEYRGRIHVYMAFKWTGPADRGMEYKL